MKSLAAGLALAGLFLASTARADTLVVRITNVRNAKGVVHVDVCPKDRFLEEDCPYSGASPATSGTTVVTVKGLPKGIYAVQAFHDENRNAKVDRALFGIPKEGIGFSNDAPIHLSPPKWKDAEFAFSGARQTITLRMRYMIGRSGPDRD